MVHKYSVEGMGCQGCKTNVEKALRGLNEVENIIVDLQKAEAIIEMSSHIPLETLQDTLLKAGLHYTISLPNKEDEIKPKENHNHNNESSLKKNKKGVYYCPMNCEGDKTYDHFGSCPVCGMDLVILEPKEGEEEKLYKGLVKKMIISTILAFLVFIIAMSDMIKNNPKTIIT
jgi:Cu2+-exporting ATPase